MRASLALRLQFGTGIDGTTDRGILMATVTVVLDVGPLAEVAIADARMNNGPVNDSPRAWRMQPDTMPKFICHHPHRGGREFFCFDSAVEFNSRFLSQSASFSRL